jgi:hypothetical protein
MTVSDVVAKLGARRVGKGWQARCPAHEDRTPSLSIDEGEDGRVLVHCHAGCEPDAVARALGCTLAEFSPPKGKHGSGHREPVATYTYTDSQGRPVFHRDRYEWFEAGERQKAVYPRQLDGSRRGNVPVPYRLHAFAEAIREETTIILVEGEKAADALHERGYTATTTGSSESWRPQFAEHFRGAHVVLWPDHDAKGEKYIAAAARDLAPLVADLRVLRFPNKPEKWDAADYFAEGGTEEQLDHLLADAPQWASAVSDAPAEDALTVRTLADIDSTPPADLWLGMFEPDGQTMLYGHGGLGKGATAAYAIGELQKNGIKTLIYDAENRPKEWARRCEGLGIDRTRVAYVQPRDLPRTLLGQPLWIIVPHLGKLAQHAGAGVLLVDSILAGMNVGEERLKSDAQAPYLYVAALDTIGLPAVSIAHTPRSTPEGDPYGSVSWVNAMRLTWLGTVAEGEGHRVRWRPRKRNERGAIPGVLLHFQYADGRTLTGVERFDDELDTRAWITGALARHERTVEELAEQLVETFDEVNAAVLERTKSRLRQALNRMKRDLLVTKSNDKRNSPWRLVRDGVSRRDLE